MDSEVAVHLGLVTPELERLERSVIGSYQAAAWGVDCYASITDERQRALASDSLVSLIDGLKTGLLDLTLASRRYGRLLGPNGRTMPGPETTVDYRVELAEMEAASTEAFRAFGSSLDCLAALAVLLYGIPLSVNRAEGSWLVQRPKGPHAPDTQEELWTRLVEMVKGEADRPEPGWLAWSLEMRNAVVHRGQLLRTWLNRPGRRPGDPQLLVDTQKDPAYLVRVEQHLRRNPWRPDMEALVKTDHITDLWLAEPAQRTLDHLCQRTVQLSEAAAAQFNDAWPPVDFVWPIANWGLASRDAGWRIDMAKAFAGFEPDYRTPPPGLLRMHPDSAKRAELAQRLRTRQQ